MALRILHIDCGREWRGGQRQVFLLAQSLRDHGWEPLVVAPPGTPLVQRLRARGVAVSAVRMRGVWDIPAVRRLRALIRTWRPDVVHAHDVRAHTLAIGALLAQREIPLVVTRRTPLDRRVIGVRYGARVARFIAISRTVRDSMVACGVDDERVSVVYAGVPTPDAGERRDWRAECRWPEDCVVCGIAGAMTGDAGADVLEAIVRALPESARRRARLVLLGGRSTGACEIGGAAAFRAGHVDEMRPAMAGLDLLLHPSRADGLGTVVVEAMALGVPPISYGVGALTELIEQDRTGVLVSPGDTDAFAAAAARLIEDDDLRRRMAGHGPDRARQFDVSRTVTEIERVYSELLGATPAVPGCIPG
jgi:glycosyltransferase involved in cell wall biosynthesis